MASGRRYPAELRERALRMVAEADRGPVERPSGDGVESLRAEQNEWQNEWQSCRFMLLVAVRCVERHPSAIRLFAGGNVAGALP